MENFSCFCREAAKDEQVDGSTENTLIVKATCQQKQIQINMSEDLQFKITNKTFTTTLIIIDLLSMLLFVLFTAKLSQLNNIRLRELVSDEPQIKINAFTMTINNFPVTKSTQDARILQMKLWLKINDALAQK